MEGEDLRTQIDSWGVDVEKHGEKILCAFPEVRERCSEEETFGRYFTMMAVCLKCQLKTACYILK